MRVCIVGSSKRFFSGITTHTIFLANALAKRNQVSVILLRKLLPRFLFPGRGRVGKDQYSIDFAPGIEVYDGMDYNSPLSWLRAYRFLKQQKPEVIIMQWWSSSVAHMQLFLKWANSVNIKAKMILDMHEVVDPLEESIMPIRLYSRVIGRRLVRGLDAYITHSESAKSQVARTYKIDDDTISVIQMGLYEDYRQPMDKALAKEELGTGEEFVILYFGLIRHYKGVPCLVKAFDLLPSPIASRSRLLIVGEVWDEGVLQLQKPDQPCPSLCPGLHDPEILCGGGCGGAALPKGCRQRRSPYCHGLWKAPHRLRCRGFEGVHGRLSGSSVLPSR